MARTKRVFILGAGFSKPAGMPLATELLPSLAQKLKLDEMQQWLDSLGARLAWLSEGQASSFNLNIEQVFHYAHFDAEVHRLRQHFEAVGRGDGPGTSWENAESIMAWLSYLEEDLCEVILEKEDQADLAPITRWAENVHTHDSVLTFNYDTLVERAFTDLEKMWNHGTGREANDEIGLFKLHGSLDWIVAHRSENFGGLDILFDKENLNRSEQNTGNIEDDYRLWRCRTWDQLKRWINDRHIQSVPDDALPRTVGIAGLGTFKQLHQIPGLGPVWAKGMRSLYSADVAVVIGFSMSDFDTMAQMQFAEVSRKRHAEGRALRSIVIDPCIDDATKNRFRRVFRTVMFKEVGHETVDWSRF